MKMSLKKIERDEEQEKIFKMVKCKGFGMLIAISILIFIGLYAIFWFIAYKLKTKKRIEKLKKQKDQFSTIELIVERENIISKNFYIFITLDFLLASILILISKGI